ncbi:hypothetical protein DL98DRAFT_519009 [Cadophora sp. DSE1049]|nr:hypothetical protein DL98DRAFT_519009 [Cadophora sp. DSE1049]
MPKKGASTTHHCPKKSKGNCRYNKAKGYCTAHQTECTIHMLSTLLAKTVIRARELPS